MLRKPITYTNFNGDKVTRNFYFNLTEAELTLRHLTTDGGFVETIEKIKQSNKGSEVVPEFVKILKWTYGVKSADGETFVKNDEVWAQFEASPAYSVLIMELLLDATASAEFIKAVMPPDLAARAAEQAAKNGFRPGAQTLPQSRVEQLEAQVAAQPAPIQDFGVPTPSPVPDVPFIAPAEPVEDVTRQSTPRVLPDVTL